MVKTFAKKTKTFLMSSTRGNTEPGAVLLTVGRKKKANGRRGVSCFAD